MRVGTRVRCALHYCGQGVVFAIHGVQAPESVQTVLDRVGVRGGHARFDVVFENGSISRDLSEAIVRGIQWTIYDDQADEAEIARLLQHAEETRIEKERDQAQAVQAFAAEVERLQSAPEMAHLTQGDDIYSGKLAAQNMRAALRKAFPKVKFSVRKTSYGSVTVSWTDGPTTREVEAIVDRHQGGHFDGMEDIYKHEKTPFVAVFGGAEYVFTRREYTETMIERAIVRVFDTYAGNLAAIERPTAAAFQAGGLSYMNVPHLGESLQALIRQELAGLNLDTQQQEPAKVESAEAVDEQQSQDVTTEAQPRPLNWYERKQVARRERLEDRAAALSDESSRAYAKARQMASVIPFGQPILVGHHSEGRDRNYRARIHSNFGKSFALQDKAKHYEQKAASVGTGGISSDDPDAIEKLRAELANVEQAQERMKAANKAIRTHKTQEARIAALVAQGLTEGQAAELLKPDYAGRVGFPSYALSNNNANARRIAGRIAELETRRQCIDVEQEAENYTYREDTEENRVMFVFPGKPDEQTRTLLKRHAFKWSPSRGAWVRQLNNAGRWAAAQVRQLLDKQISQ
ncbi:hypothetical protein D9M71_109200 [compost metagenome]